MNQSDLLHSDRSLCLSLCDDLKDTSRHKEAVGRIAVEGIRLGW